MAIVHHSTCPSCGSNQIELSMSVKDHSVSGEFFNVFDCLHCSLRFTQDAPDQENVSRYYQSADYVSHTDTKEGFINKLYHVIRSFTLGAKRKMVSRYAKMKNGKILDVGCGTGAFLNEMKQHGWEAEGLEPDATAMEKAKSLYGITARLPKELFNIGEASFDAITMWHVLEHVHQLQEYIVQLKKIIKDDGVIFIAVPNYTSFDASHYYKNWAAYDVPRHLYHFSPESMKVLMEKHGLKIRAIKPMWFDSFYVSMLSEKYKNGKNNHAAAFFIGLFSNIKTVFNKNNCSSVVYVIGKCKM